MKEINSLRPSKDALLNPKMDPTFKALFTQKTIASKKALEAFLSAIFNQKVTDVVIGQNEIPIESERDKQSIFDINCTLSDQQQVINVEMQGVNYLQAFDNRSEYHVAHLLNNFVHKGTSWHRVPQAYMISVLNFIYEEKAGADLLWYTMKRENCSELKSKRMNIIYLELPKFLKISDEPVEKLTEIQRWAKFFLYADKKEKAEYVRKLAELEEGIMYAQETLSQISQSDEEWRRERDYIDAVNTELTIKMEAEERGFSEGFERGISAGMQQGLE